MLAEVTRSGETESFHDGAVAVVDTAGELIADYGDIDRLFFARSSVKPFQARVSIDAGARLHPEWRAVACSSHTGAPVHLAIVDAMLESVGLSRTALKTPADWPHGANRDRLLHASHPGPEPRFHNCSGKHAAFLMACRASGWDLETYFDPTHPLQRSAAAVLADVTGIGPGTPGVDGCGAPTHLVSVRGLATAFSRLGNDPAFSDVLESMHRYPRLVSGVDMVDAEIAVLLGAAAKRGAEGNIGVAVPGHGAIAVKVDDGSMRPIGPVLAHVVEQLGWASPSTLERLRSRTEVAMSGGGRQVGTVRSLVELNAR